MRRVLGFLLYLPLIILSPLLILIPMAAIALADAFWSIAGRKRLLPAIRPSTLSASVVIPNWNGRDLLEKYLPSVVEAMSLHPGNEVIVVDNGSTDGSAEFMKTHFPDVRVIRAAHELGLRWRFERRLPRREE